MAEIPHYDLAVIGSGPAGYVAAIRGGQLGLKTAIIEAEEFYGGTCLHRGCIPTKALLFNAEVYGYFQNAREYGINCKQFSLDWDAIERRKDKIVKKLAQGVEFLLKKNKVEIMQGHGRLAGKGRIVVSTPKSREIEARCIILATGSEARTLAGLEPDAKTIFTNKEVLAVKQAPDSMVIMGAGAVGVEFASIFHRLGTRVTLLEMLPRVLPSEDEEISAEIEKSLRKQGITLHTQAKVESAAKTGKIIRVVFSARDGSVERVDAETLLIAIGRIPNTQDIGIENTKIVCERGFIKVDGFMQTNEPGVYAIGDIVAGSPMLAHVGEMEGIVAATCAAGKKAEPVNYRQVPNCIYSEPEVASVGLTEKQAREASYRIRVGKFPFSANSKAAILGARDGFVKIVSEERYGEILGVHLIGPRVTEMIAEAVVAMRLEATAEDLAHAIHPHPTLTEAILEAAHAAHDWPIHI
ncbi:MAG TPA: dihydrolipoyl dehydrogenase [Terriglobia bacterium]|nr:dihydrolipoyl dehydrogenase [Terriglobia bacterium]